MGDGQKSLENNGDSPEHSSSSSSAGLPHLTSAPQSQRQTLLSSEDEQDSSSSSSEAMKEDSAASRISSPDSNEEPHLQDSSSNNTSNSSWVSEENGKNESNQKKEKKKLKSETSVVHDKEKGISSCKRCGWNYPNPRPSAKLRREHRRHCGKFQHVHAWLSSEKEQQQEEGSGEAGEDLAVEDSEEDDASSSQEASEVTKEDLDKEAASSIQPEASETPKEQQEDASSSQSIQQEASETTKEQQDLERKDASSSLSHKLEDEPSLKEELEPEQGKFQSNEQQELVDRDENRVPDKGTVPRHEDHHPAEAERNSEITRGNDQSPEEPESSKISEYDLEKILKEQTSHHLLCPNCGSCITKRVILKKRKRTGGFSVSAGQLEKQLKLEKEGDGVEVERDRGVEIEQVPAAAGAEDEREEQEAWSCLACFAIFFRKVHETLDESVDRARHFSCVPYLLPEFHWDGDGTQVIQEEDEPRSSSCLPIEFPWTKTTEPSVQEEADETPGEMDISPEETQTPPEVPPDEDEEQRESSSCFPISFPSLQKSSAEVTGHDEQEQQEADRFSCIPVLLPAYWSPDEPASSLQEPESETNEGKAGFSCLPDLIPSWSTWKSDEPQQISEPEEREPEHEPEPEPQLEPEPEHKALEQEPEPEPKPEREREPEPEREHEPEHKVSVDLEREPDQPSVATETSEAREVDGEPTPDSAQVEETADIPGTVEDKSCNCLPVSIPKYSWGSQKVAPDDQAPNEVQNNQKVASLNCLPDLFPPFSWDGDEEYAKSLEKKEVKEEDLPTSTLVREESDEEKTYITKETRIQGWIRTLTNVVTVRPAQKQIDRVQIGDETSFLDMTVKQKTGVKETKPTAQTLVSKPSTGWAIYDAMDETRRVKPAEDEEQEESEEEDVRLIDSRKRPPKLKEIEQQTEIQEVDERPDEQPARIQELKDKEVPPPLELDTGLREPLLTADEKPKELSVEAILSAFAQQNPDGKLDLGPVSTTVSVKGSDSFVEITGDDAKQAVETALDMASLSQLLPKQEPEPVQEYVKSIVYGGLDVTLTSLAVISSGAGSGTKTLNIVAISIANLIAGLITLLYSISNLYRTNRRSFEQYVGQKLWLNGGIAVISFLVFGCVAPLTYALSFRSGDDHDYKFAATAAASLACLCLLGLGKAHVHKEGYLATIASLVATGFVASVAGYFAGDYVKRWLQKLGFDIDETPPPPPAAPSPPWPPFPLHLPGGRRGGASM